MYVIKPIKTGMYRQKEKMKMFDLMAFKNEAKNKDKPKKELTKEEQERQEMMLASDERTTLGYYLEEEE